MTEAIEAASGRAQTAPTEADDTANSPQVATKREANRASHDGSDARRLQRHLHATVGRLFARSMHVGSHGPFTTPPNLLIARSSDSSASPIGAPVRAISGLSNAPRRPGSASRGSRPENLSERPASAMDGSRNGASYGPNAPTTTAAPNAKARRPDSVASRSSGAASPRCCTPRPIVRCYQSAVRFAEALLCPFRLQCLLP